MNVTFNNEVVSNAPSLLHDLLLQKELTTKTGIAVAVNNSVIAKSEWENKKLKENDAIVVITATAGG